MEGDTSSDHKPILGVLGVEDVHKKNGCRTAWPVFSLILSYTAGYWDQMWEEISYDGVYEKFITFLVRLADRCKSYFPARMTRPTVPYELMKLLTRSRTLSFKAKRTGDIRLREDARFLRNQARHELKKFQQDQLEKLVKGRHTPGDGSRFFWRLPKENSEIIRPH